MSRPNARSDADYTKGVNEANTIIERHDAEWLEDSRKIAQALWNTDPKGGAYLRGMLDTIHEYQHRGDETP